MSNFKLFLKESFPGIIYKYLNLKNPTRKHKFDLFKKYQINCLLDVGANVGLYGHAVRYSGYSNEIISFEPLSDSFKQLEKLSSKDNNWKALNFALGDFDGETDINISDDSVSSSLLPKTNEFKEMFPNIRYSKTEKIKVCKLDSIFDEICKNKRVFLKLDTQGFEKNILDGAINSMQMISGLQIELSVQQLYENELLFNEMFSYIQSLGFNLKVIEEGWYKDNEIVQFDGIFFRD